MELVSHQRDIHLEINENNNRINNYNESKVKNKASTKVIFELIFTIVSFLIKIICIYNLVNKYGILLITKDYHTDSYSFIDTIHLETKEAYTLFPLNVKTELEEMYLDSTTSEPLKDSLRDGVLDHLDVECNIKINYDKIDCDENCIEILKGYEKKQKNEELSMCIYKNKINFFLQIINFYGPCFVFEILFIKNAKKMYYISVEYLKLPNLNSASTLEHKNNVNYYKKINFLLPYILAFIWNDLTNYIIASKNSINLYNNYYDIDDYQKLEIDYSEKGLLQFIVGLMNNPIIGTFIWIPGFNLILLIPKMIFSLANISFVFKNIFNFDMFSKLFELKYGLDSLQLNTPIFWYYWDCFFAIIIKFCVFTLFDCLCI